jgi:hypothetical protein
MRPSNTHSVRIGEKAVDAELTRLLEPGMLQHLGMTVRQVTELMRFGAPALRPAARSLLAIEQAFVSAIQVYPSSRDREALTLICEALVTEFSRRLRVVP